MATFGNTSLNVNGANNLGPSNPFNAAAWTGVAPGNMGTVISISGEITGSGTNSFAIWNVSGGTVGTLVANSGVSVSAGAGFTTVTYTGTPPVLVAGNTYAIGYVSGSLSTLYHYTPFTSGGTAPSFVLSNNVTGPTPGNITNQSQAAGDGAGFDMSFYVTYNPGAGATSVPYKSLLGVGI